MTAHAAQETISPEGACPAELHHASLEGRIDDISLRVAAGECTVLVGPNGAGKSSILRALLGLLTLEGGSAELGGVAVQTMGARERAERIAWLPQRPQVSPDLTVEELVVQSRFRFDEPASKSRLVAAPILQEVGVRRIAQRRVTEISGGELQRALVAALIAQESPLLLVDEPANHLDPAHQLETYKRLGKLWRKGHGLCIVTHDIRLCRLLGRPDEVSVVGLKAGRQAFKTQLSDPELSALLGELYGVPFLPLDSPGALALALPQEEG